MTALYDQLNGWGSDYDYWLALAGTSSRLDVADLGCGTGQLTVLLARAGHRVVGIDADPGMLQVARARDGYELVTWVQGYADDIATASTDLVTMTSHVSQVFLTDTDWAHALRELRRALRPGGRVAFDMRNPHARGWEAWNPTDSRRSVSTDSGPAEVWHEVIAVEGQLVTFETTTRYADRGRVEVDTDVLRFRDEPPLRTSLVSAGFAVGQVHGNWDGTPATKLSEELIITATRTERPPAERPSTAAAARQGVPGSATSARARPDTGDCPDFR